MVYLLSLLNTIVVASALFTSLAAAIPTATLDTSGLEATYEHKNKRQAIGNYPAPGSNNYSCRSTKYPNPVVFLHGLGANSNSDLNVLQTNLSNSGYCTFSLTYGENPSWPGVGGLRPIPESSVQIASFIRQVQSRTKASKIDLVGHSEGAFMALYVPKFGQGVAPIVDKVVAIAPPTNGTKFPLEIYQFVLWGGPLTEGVVESIAAGVGCQACADVAADSKVVRQLNDGKPIRQPGNTVTVIISRDDQIVTPPETSLIRENGVRNIFVQDGCPFDPVGHNGLVYDTYVWGLVRNALTPTSKLYPCTLGLPY